MSIFPHHGPGLHYIFSIFDCRLLLKVYSDKNWSFFFRENVAFQQVWCGLLHLLVDTLKTISSLSDVVLIQNLHQGQDSLSMIVPLLKFLFCAKICDFLLKFVSLFFYLFTLMWCEWNLWVTWWLGCTMQHKFQENYFLSELYLPIKLRICYLMVVFPLVRERDAIPALFHSCMSVCPALSDMVQILHLRLYRMGMP